MHVVITAQHIIWIEPPNRYSYDNLAAVSDRYCVRSQATAAVANALLEDMGLINDENNLDRK